MQRNFFSLLLSKSILSLTAVGLVVLSLTGCGIGPAAVSTPEAVVLPAISGVVMGGEAPVSGANVILWETDPGNTGYGVPTSGSAIGAQQLATATGGVNGAFSFTAGSYTCAPGQFAYITSTGGDASNGGGTEINNNLVLIAALGSCSNFSSAGAESGIKIIVNELSTVAAAYALNSFMTVNVNGNAGTQLVYIGAPANNNATTGACTTPTPGSAYGVGGMTCTAAGLAHAFTNASNLVDAVHYDSTFPTGLARTTVPGNSLGSVPQAVINSLGDIMSYCTQSASSGTGGTNCAAFFGDATAPTGSAPTDTLSAMVNIAKNPRNKIGTTCTGGPPATSGGLFCLISGIAAPWPALSAIPHDWTVAIAYSGASTLTPSNFGVPQYLTLDANDNVYIMTGDSGAPTKLGMAAISSAGAGLWANAMNTNNVVPGTLATDTNGYIWQSLSAASGGNFALLGYLASTGSSGTPVYSITNSSSPAAVQSTTNGMAFDRNNNLWYGRKSSSCTNCVFEFPFTAGSPGTYGAAQNVISNTATSGPFNIIDISQMLIDSKANIWMSDVVTSPNGQIYVYPNTSPSTPNAPTYAPSTNSTTIGFLTGNLPASSNGGLGIDSAGNIWTGSNANVSEFTPTLTSGAVTAIGSPINTTTTASKPYPGEVDGLGAYWYGSFTTSGGVFYQYTPSSPQHSGTASKNSDDVVPCYAPAGATTCSSTIPTADPRVVQADSAGALWVNGQVGATTATTQGYVVQILGAASPTWPQTSYGVFGTEPQ